MQGTMRDSGECIFHVVEVKRVCLQVSSAQVALRPFVVRDPLLPTNITSSTVYAEPRMAGHDPLSEFVLGYPKLAAQMALQPETSIFRRFGFLNAQNLLYFQAELTILEEQLQKRQKLDSLGTTGRKSKYARNWFWLEQSRDDGDTCQLDLVLRIRETMKEYSRFVVALTRL